MKKTLSLLLAFCTCFTIGTTFSACKHEHEASGWTTTVEATCSSEGKREKLCSCGLSMEEESLPVNPNNHASKSWQITKPATCRDSGLKDEHCLGCDKILQTNVVIPKTKACITTIY